MIRKLCSLNLDKRHGYTKYLDNIFHYMDHFVRKEELDEKVPKTYQKTKR